MIAVSFCTYPSGFQFAKQAEMSNLTFEHVNIEVATWNVLTNTVHDGRLQRGTGGTQELEDLQSGRYNTFLQLDNEVLTYFRVAV